MSALRSISIVEMETPTLAVVEILTSPSGVYRTPAEKEPREPPPRELVYEATDESAIGNSQVALFQFFSLPFLAAAGLAWLAGPAAGGAGFVAGLAHSIWSWRTRKKRGGAVLRVENGVLDVDVFGDKQQTERFALADLADVSLDVKTIERVMEGNVAIPALRFIDATVGPKVDTARIVLVSDGGREVRLSEEFLPHMHATEWLGKIRVFLRKNGWVPCDEREPQSE